MLAVLLALGLLTAPALAALAKTGDASVVFHAVGPAGLKIDGRTTELEVAEVEGKLRITVPLANVDTGISLRNKHMREKYLEVPKYPNAELVLNKAGLNLPLDGQQSSGTANGILTIHGQAKPAVVHYTVNRSGPSYTVKGDTHVNVKDYGIEIPSYLGVTVKPEMDIDVQFTAVDR